MGLGYTPAIPFNTVKSIKTLTQHAGENEQRKEKELTVDEEEENSDTEGTTLSMSVEETAK